MFGDLPQGVRSIVPAPVLAQLRKNAIAVGSGTPSSARGCRIAEITGSNPLSSTRKSARPDLISYATGAVDRNDIHHRGDFRPGGGLRPQCGA